MIQIDPQPQTDNKNTATLYRLELNTSVWHDVFMILTSCSFLCAPFLVLSFVFVIVSCSNLKSKVSVPTVSHILPYVSQSWKFIPAMPNQKPPPHPPHISDEKDDLWCKVGNSVNWFTTILPLAQLAYCVLQEHWCQLISKIMQVIVNKWNYSHYLQLLVWKMIYKYKLRQLFSGNSTDVVVYFGGGLKPNYVQLGQERRYFK